MLRTLVVFGMSVATWIAPQAVSPGAVAGTQQGPNVSGRWLREPGNMADAAGNNAGWGPSVEIEQNDNELTVRSLGQPPTRYKADGSEVTESLAKASCFEQSRVTKTVATPRSFTITTWLLTRNACFHDVRVVTDDPETFRKLQESPAGVTKRIESVTTVARVGDQLTVDTTAALPNGSTGTSSSTYRK